MHLPPHIFWCWWSAEISMHTLKSWNTSTVFYLDPLLTSKIDTNIFWNWQKNYNRKKNSKNCLIYVNSFLIDCKIFLICLFSSTFSTPGKSGSVSWYISLKELIWLFNLKINNGLSKFPIVLSPHITRATFLFSGLNGPWWFKT